MDTSKPIDFTTPNRHESISLIKNSRNSDRANQQKRKDRSPIDHAVFAKHVDDRTSPDLSNTLVYDKEREQNMPLLSLVNDMLKDSFKGKMPVISPTAPQLDVALDNCGESRNQLSGTVNLSGRSC